METTVASMLGAGAGRYATSPAIVAPHRRPLSHERLWRQVAGVVAWLNAAGITRHDRVAIVLPNGPDLVTAFLGVCAGAASAPLNPGYRADEFDFYLEDLGARALIVQRGLDSPARAMAHARGIAVLELSPGIDQEAGIFTLNGDALIGRDGGTYAGSDDVALVLHTSGTTARPKRVPLTHTNLVMSAKNVATSLSLSAGDRCLNVMPLFHIHGLVAAVLASLSAGASVICPPGFDGSAFFGWMADFRPSWYTAVPTIHQEILRRAPLAADIIAQHPLRLIRSSSAALAPRVMAELEAVFNAPVIEAYGMTEAAHQIASNPLPPRKRIPGSVGLAGACQVAVMDARGTLLPAGQVGEVVICGPVVTRGYENNPEANAAAFSNGWCRTGDQGVIDIEGYLSLTGRLKEMINCGGEKIAPREIDEVLLSHPDVQEAVAFPVVHATLGEAVAAAVVPREGRNLSEHVVREHALRHLPDFKVPTRIVVVSQIPKGATGKLQRIGLATLLAHELAIAYEPPGAGLEQLSATIFEEVLQLDRVGRNDNFFALGGDSIRATQVVARLMKALGVEIPPTTLFHHPTPASLGIDLASLQQEQDVAALAADLQKLPEDEAVRILRRASEDDA